MPTTRPCFAASQLERLLTAGVPAHELDSAAQHLEECPQCAHQLDALLKHDTLMEAARSRTSVDDPEADAVRGLIDRVRGLHSASAAPEEAREHFPFLAAPEQPDEMGRLGGYRVLKVLGSGGMGVVFLAEDPRLKRPVALKVMKPDATAKPGARQRFLREAQAAAAVKHDHVITIYQVGQDRDVPFMAMELLEGENLDDWLKRGKRPTTAQLLRLGREIAKGLAAAHAKGLIHRDVKPGNIWLEAPTGRVKLLDFGLVRPAEDNFHLTQSGIIVGTPAYMAPEQADGLDLDHRCDLFSLGCVLYRLGTGEPAFRGNNPVALLTSVVRDEPTAVQELNPNLSGPLAELIMKLLAKNRDQRPASADEVVRQLKAVERAATPSVLIARPVEIVTPPPTAPAKSSPPVAPKPTPLPTRRRRLPPVWVAAAAVLFCLIGGGVLLHQVIVKITHPDGTTKEEMHPAGSKVEIIPVLPPLPEGPSPIDQFQRKNISAYELKIAGWGAPGGQPPAELVGVLGESRLKHRDGFFGVSWSPDGKHLAGCSTSAPLHIWDAANGQEVAAIDIFPSGALAYRPGPQAVLAYGVQKPTHAIRVVEAPSGKLLHELPMDTRAIAGVAWSFDGKLLAATDYNGLVKAWDGDGKELFSHHGSPGTFHCAFNHDGTRLAFRGQDAKVKVFDMKTQKEVPFPESSPGEVHCVTFSPDGKLFAAGSFMRPLKVWDAETGKEVKSLPASAVTMALAFSPDSRWLAFGGDGSTVAVWDTQTWGKIVLTTSGEHVRGLAFSPDSTRLATSASSGRVQVWDFPNAKEAVPVAGHHGSVKSVAVSPNGEWIASCSLADKTVRLWDAKGQGEVLFTHDCAPWDVAFSSDSNSLAVGDERGTIVIWDRVKKARRLKVEGHQGVVNDVCFSRDGKLLASAGRDNSVRIHDAKTGKPLHVLTGHTGDGVSVAFSPDGTRLASGSHDGTVRIWDVQTGKERLKLDQAKIARSVVFSPDGQFLLTAGSEHLLRLWDAQTGKEVRVFFTDRHKQDALSAAFSPNGQFVFSYDGSNKIILWETATGKVLRQVQLGTYVTIRHLAVAPDGRHIVTANGNGTLYVLRFDSLPSGKFPPLDPAWVEAVKTKPVEEHANGITEELKHRNPGFDGQVAAGGKDSIPFWTVTRSSTIRDLTPLSAILNLKRLTIEGVHGAKGLELDLTPLAGLALETLRLENVNCTDLRPLMGMPLTILAIPNTQVKDLTPLRDMKKLDTLICTQTPVEDLTAVAGLPLRNLYIPKGVTDLTPLGRMPLVNLRLDLKPYKGVEVVRGLKTLKQINEKPAAEFWKEYDAKFAPPAAGPLGPWSHAEVDPYEAGIAGWPDGPVPELVAVLGESRLKSVNGIHSVSWSPDKKHLATVCLSDNSVTVWDADTGRRVARQAYPFPVSAAYKPITGELAVVGRDGLWVGDGLTGKNRWQRSTSKALRSITWSPDGKRLATTPNKPDRTVTVWDEDGKEVFTIPDLFDESGPASNVAFSPDGTRLAFPHKDGKVKVWDVKAQKEVLTTESDGSRPRCVAFSPDDKRLATGGAGKVKVCDAATGQEVNSLKISGTSMALAFSPDGRWLAASVSPSNNVIVWNTESWRETAMPAPRKLVYDLAFDRDSKRLAAANDVGVLHIWDFENAKALLPVPGHQGAVKDVAVSPDGQAIVSCGDDQTVRLWDVKGRDQVLLDHDSSLFAVAFSPDGEFLAHGDHKGTVLVWDRAKKAARFKKTEHDQVVYDVCFSPDGKLVASASADQTVKVRDAFTGDQTLVLKGHTAAIWCVAFSSDGNLLATGSADNSGKDLDNTARLWDAATGKVVHKLACPGGVKSVAFSPDGRHLLTAGATTTPLVWDVKTGQKVRALEGGHAGGLSWATYSPSGQNIVSVDGFNKVVVWEAATGKVLRAVPLSKYVGVRRLVAAPDGLHVVTANSNGTLYVLRLDGALDGQKFPPLDPAWVEAVKMKPVEEQVKAVVEELRRRNPEFAGRVEPHTKDDDLTWFVTDCAAIRDLTPLRALPNLKKLAFRTQPGKKGPPLDLTPLTGLALEKLEIPDANVTDLSPLKGMPLVHLEMSRNPVKDLSPLKGMRLLSLHCSETAVEDLLPLQDMPLNALYMTQTAVTDLTPLGGSRPLHLRLDLKPYKGAEVVKGLKTLKQINEKPVEEFWKEYDAKFGKPPQGFAPPDQNWQKAVGEMKPEDQAKAIAAELKRRNPGYDGSLEPPVADGRQSWIVTGCAALRDLTPLQALPGLKKLALYTPRGNQGPPLDLTPLAGLALEELGLESVNVSDLSPLRGMPLNYLRMINVPVKDLSPLRGMPLNTLICPDTPIEDLTPIKGMSLVALFIHQTAVSDLTPLEGMPLKGLIVDFKPYKGVEVVKGLKTVGQINDKPAAEFWKNYDAKFGPPK